MERFFTLVALFVFGAAFGSFACCQVWRIRKKDKSKWSHCMKCKYKLRWYDNVPILSWILLGGKCRKCRKKIGCAEILAEVGLALAFVLSFVFWPNNARLISLDVLEVLKFGLFLVQLTIFTILFIYDAKWKELPLGLMIAAIAIAAVFCGLNIAISYINTGVFDWGGLLIGFAILPGIYFLLYKISGEAWVGGGDWILCISLWLMLGDMWLAMMCLFASNMIGSVVMLPVVMIKKQKSTLIPFGPFLIMGFWLVFMSQNLIYSYMGL